MATLLQSPTRARRTNSLGRAKGPCDSCLQAGIACDRSRPKCSNCTGRKLTCPGYRVDLVWQFGVASRGNLAGFNYPSSGVETSRSSYESSTTSKKSRWRGKSSKATGERSFKFVEGKPVGKRGRKRAHPPSPEAQNYSPQGISNYIEDNVHNIMNSPSIFGNYGDPLPPLPVAEAHVYSENLSSDPPVQSGISEEFVSTDPWLLQDQDLVSQEQTEVEEVFNDFQLSIPARMSFGTLNQQYNHILSCYDQHICAIPLTADCFLNPFRVLNESYGVSQHLLHAIMATSLFHLNRNNESTESTALVNSHQSESLGLYSQALNGLLHQTTSVQFLDTALLLMYLDSAQCAVGLYHIHLQGIRGIIDSYGGESALIPNSSKLRAQLAMFIWYDSTIALLAREDLVLPLSYLEGILRHGNADGWSYLDLSGCQEEFVVIMAKIAGLAQQHETALNKENLHFDMSAVDEVEDALKHVPVPYPLLDEDSDEEALDVARDRYHCSEAWRNALLLYIERVFRWNRGGPVPVSVRYISRSIMEHARCIRKENTFQKQILLPIFLAGAEMKREEDKAFVREYCSWWTRMCGSKMFIDACSYCEEIWALSDTPEAQGVWWGVIVDRHCSDSGLPMRPQVLLG